MLVVFSANTTRDPSSDNFLEELWNGKRTFEEFEQNKEQALPVL